MISHRNIIAYVQLEMHNLLTEYSFAKTYIDDVIIFNKTLKIYFKNLEKIFVLFQKIIITLKTIKIYLKYFILILLNQKINNLCLSTTKNKLKMIVNMSFSKTLKDLKTYLNATN